MTRQECEKAIADKVKEIGKIYRSYNPNGEYLSICILDDWLSFNNAHWEEDIISPINYSEALED